MPEDRTIRFTGEAAHAFPGVYRIEGVDTASGRLFVRPVGREAKSRWPHYGFSFWFPIDHEDFEHELLKRVQH